MQIDMSQKVIEIRNLNYSYPDRTKAISDINLDIYEGESVGIIGPNGAGKTTLLLHLNGILKGNGSVVICGLKIQGQDKNLPKIRKKVGMIFQDPNAQLFIPTVFDDVAFGPLNMNLSKKEVEESVNQALEEVDMSGAIHKLAHHLSLGEKRRISIATVLSMKPDILAMDEPTSNLDPKHRRMLIGLIKNFSHTKIIASHDLDLIWDVCNRIIMLDKGSIVAQGETIEILKNKDLLEKHDLEIPLSLSR